jgi:hypothetical protein
MSQFLPIARTEKIVIQELENEVLIYDLNLDKAYCLNETSATIWQLCDGSKTVPEISQAVSKKFGATASDDMVWLALEQLKKDQLISNEFQSTFSGLSRRAAIRKMGLASAIALPTIISIIAPTSACAATLDCSCRTPGDCLTKTFCPSTVNCNPQKQCAP